MARLTASKTSEMLQTEVE